MPLKLSDFFLAEILLLLILLSVPSSAKNQVDLNLFPSVQVDSVVSNDAYLPDLAWIVEEESISLSAEKLAANDIADATFIKLNPDSLFSIKANKYYWFNIEVVNHGSLQNKSLHLYRTGNCWPWEITFYELEAYQFENGETIKIGTTGNNIIATERDVPHILDPSILGLKKISSTSSLIWIRLIVVEACDMSIKMKFIDDAITFANKPLTFSLITNLMILGADSVMFFLTLFLFLKFHDRVYVWFSFYLVSQFLHKIYIEFPNELFQYVFFDHPRMFVLSYTILTVFLLLSMIQFWRAYINTGGSYPKIHKFIGYLLFYFIIVCLVGITLRMTGWSFDPWFKIRQVFMFFFFSTLSVIILYLIVKGNQLVRFLSLGVLFVVFMFVIAVILINFTQNTNPMAFDGIVGMAMLTIMGMAMAYRFILINDEKQLALTEKIQVEKQNTEQLFRINAASDKFVPNAFLNFLGKKNILQAALGDSIEQDVSILFSDLRNFTSISEGLSPKETFKFVSDFNKGIGPIITKHNGFINQYLGDGIMAIFPDHPNDAINAALEMIAYQKEQGKMIEKISKHPLEIGIGIHYGSIIMGIMGDEHRLDAAILSDAVNLAARIETQTKRYKAQLLFSEEFFQKLQNKSDFEIRCLGASKVKGKSYKIKLYQGLDYLNKEQLDKVIKHDELFEKAIQLLDLGKEQEAILLFDKIYDLNPQDLTVKAILEMYKTNESL